MPRQIVFTCATAIFIAFTIPDFIVVPTAGIMAIAVCRVVPSILMITGIAMYSKPEKQKVTMYFIQPVAVFCCTFIISIEMLLSYDAGRYVYFTGVALCLQYVASGTFVLYQGKLLTLTICSLSSFIMLSDRIYIEDSYFTLTTVFMAYCTFVCTQSVYLSELRARDDFLYTETITKAKNTADLMHKNADDLLFKILPKPVANRLKIDREAFAQKEESCAVLFADLCGFTTFSMVYPPETVVGFLDKLFHVIDEVIEKYEGVEKIKTIGDAYMIVAGGPFPVEKPMKVLAHVALDMADATSKLMRPDGKPATMRIGLNSGPVVAGVIGLLKPVFDLWGHTVNTAARMESHGVPGRIQVTKEVFDELNSESDFEFEGRGLIDIKGVGLG